MKVFGIVVAFLALAVKAQTTSDPTVLRGAWQAMDVAGGWVIVPLAISSLVTGLVMSLGTVGPVPPLLGPDLPGHDHTRHPGPALEHADGALLRRATDPTTTEATLRTGLRGEFLHAGVGLVVLLVIQALNIYEPRA